MSASRNALLEKVRRQRVERTRPATIGGDEYGYLSLMIPENDFAILIVRFPDLNSPDHETQKRAWQRFAKSPHAEPYRVERKKHARNNHRVIVK